MSAWSSAVCSSDLCDSWLDAVRVRAVRARCPDPWSGVDANQGHGAATLPALLPALVEARVSLLEQPCARGREDELDGIERVLPFAADESILDLAELEARHANFEIGSASCRERVCQYV